jgi:hypothetical protein
LDCTIQSTGHVQATKDVSLWQRNKPSLAVRLTLQVAASAALADTANSTNQSYTNAYRVGRDQAVHYGVRGWVQITLNSLRAATNPSPRFAAKRAGHQVGRIVLDSITNSKTLQLVLHLLACVTVLVTPQATALAAFRAVAPFLNSQPKGAATVKTCFDLINNLRPNSFAQVCWHRMYIVHWCPQRFCMLQEPRRRPSRTLQAKKALATFYEAQGIAMTTIYAC